MRRFVCSDIHGQYEIFLKMLQGIEFSEQDQLYILGDIIDRGPQSMELMQEIMEHDNMTCIIGNHELMMLDYINHSPDGNSWMLTGNGGAETYEQFKRLTLVEQNKIKKYIENMYPGMPK